MGFSVAESVRAGEIIVRSQVIADGDYARVAEDGRLMMSLCAGVSAKYMNPVEVEELKKNSLAESTSEKQTEATA